MDKEIITKLISSAIEKLVQNDSDIFKQKKPKLGISTVNERKLNRELHETTLNHRFAFYLEIGLIELEILNYNVDIEYNRNFSERKKVKIDLIRIPVRPDILIHKRMNTDKSSSNLLIIEAKKHKTSQHDINKVRCFMEDEQYLYKYGLTISYAYDSTMVKAVLYFRNSQKTITTENIEIKRINN